MTESTEEFPFEEFPRKTLPGNISRRELLAAILSRMAVDTDQQQGRTIRKLSELGTWDDERLAQVVPVITRNSSISMKEGYVTGKSPNSERSYKLFPVQSQALTVFNLFNGSTNIKDISLRLSEQTNWEPSRCFAYVRGVFLALVVAGLSHPKDP